MINQAHKQLTLGVEEEFQILCPETFALVPAYDTLSDQCLSYGLPVKSELHQSCCEVITKPCKTVRELEEEIRSNRLRLAESAEQVGLKVGLSGTHPFSDWKTLATTREERRLNSEYLFQEAHRQCLAFALHIHVGIPNRQLALKVMNDARRLLPILYAMSCSSPFLEGRNTGLQSSRLLRAFGFPRTGIPDTMEDLDHLDRLIETMQRAGLIVDAAQLWWDIRVHQYPTVEFRICDAVPLLRDVVSLAALTQTFVARLLDTYAQGDTIKPLDRVLVCENRWRAARFGTDAEMLDYDTLSLHPLRELVADLCEQLSPWANGLQLTDQLARVIDIAVGGSAAKRQQGLWDGQESTLKDVIAQYMAETMDL